MTNAILEKGAVRADPQPADVPLFAACGAVVLFLMGTVWRLQGLGDTGLWLDEILGVTGVGPEHGPLYYLLTATRVPFLGVELSVRLPFAVAGLATMVVTSFIGFRLSGASGAVITLAATAASPCLVFYSRDARPYELLVFVQTLGLLLLQDAQSRGWTLPKCLGFLVVSVALLASSANGLYLAAGLIVAAALTLALSPNRNRSIGVVGVLLSTLAIAILFWRLYGGLAPPMLSLQLAEWPRALELAEALIVGFDQPVPAGRPLVIGAALAVYGVVCANPKNRVMMIAFLAYSAVTLLVPTAVLSAAQHWLSARYVIGALVPGILMAAGGASILCQQLSGSARRFRQPVTWCLTVAAVVTLISVQSHTIQSAREGKADWRAVAAFLGESARPNDLVLTSNQWSYVCLDFYRKALGAAFKLVDAGESVDKAAKALSETPVAFLVQGGYHSNNAIRRYFAEFHEVFRSAKENTVITFYPDREAFLLRRLSSERSRGDARLLWRTLGGELRFDEAAERFLVTGWGGGERNGRSEPFRWMVAKRASVYVPVSGVTPVEMSVEVMPFMTLGGQQTLAVDVNGERVYSGVLQPGWATLHVPLPEAVFRDGPNVLAFMATEIDSAQSHGGDDSRQLAVCFGRLSFTLRP